MITIPTGEFVGALADVIPFACPDGDLPNVNVVRVEWDGELLHILATDMWRLAWCSWHPDDYPPGEDHQDELGVEWGGADEPWKLTLRLDDAKELAAVFKVTAKLHRTPVKVDLDRGMLRVTRTRDTGLPAITMTAAPIEVEMPDVREVLAGAKEPKATRVVAYSAKWLADFAKVRPRGPLTLRLAGPDSLTVVTVGERFRGGILPARTGPGRDDQTVKGAR